MSNEAWLKERKKGIGGSDAAAVLGLNPYSSALAVYLDKIGEGVPVEENERMAWGLKLETLIVAEYQARTGRRVSHNSDQLISIHPDHEWMLCTLDATAYREDGKPGVLQAKNVDRYMQSEWDEKVPEHYLVQLMHELAVTGYSWGALVVLIGGNEWKCFEFERDEELINIIIEKESAFWHDHVLKRIPPDPTGASLDVLAKMYRKDNGTSITLADDAIGRAITSYLDAKAHLEAYTKQKGDSEAIIKAAMGEANKGIYQGSDGTTWGISWSTVKGRVGFDSKQFEKDHPELFLKYMKQGADYRRFMVKGKKAEITNAEMAMIGG